MPKIPLVAGLAMFVSSLTAFVIMSLAGLDTSDLLVFIGVAAGIGGFGAWSNTETIKRQTNGPLTAAMRKVDELEVAVGKLTAVTKDIHEQVKD